MWSGNLSEQNFKINSSRKVVTFPRKQTHLYGFWGCTCGKRTPALVFRPTASVSIAPYSQTAKDVCTSSNFFRTTSPFSRYMGAKSPLISGTSRHVATFPLTLQRPLVRYRLHIWRPRRANRGITSTVTLDDLDLLL